MLTTNMITALQALQSAAVCRAARLLSSTLTHSLSTVNNNDHQCIRPPTSAVLPVPSTSSADSPSPSPPSAVPLQRGLWRQYWCSMHSHNQVRGMHSNEAEAGRELEAMAQQEMRQRSGARGGPQPDTEFGNAPEIFDRATKRAQRGRAAWLAGQAGRDEDPLQAAVSERLLDRLEDCLRKFPTALVVGGAADTVIPRLAGGRAGIERVVYVDSSPDMLARVKALEERARCAAAAGHAKPWPEVLYVEGDEEYLPIQHGSVDVVVSSLGLHWCNDLPGAMAQCRLALRPDGLFLAALLGGSTLQELRIACSLAMMEREGGVAPVVSPLAQVRDSGNLLTRAGLAMPTVDVDSFSTAYPGPAELAQHLRAMAETSALAGRRRAMRQGTALAAAAIYQSMFAAGPPGEGESLDREEEGIMATFQVMFLTGWAPHPDQPRAAKRGSATVSFQDLASGLVDKHGAVAGSAEGPGAEADQGQRGQ